MNVPLREMHLFAGAGGGILGGMLCGHVPVCAVELEEYPRKVLLQRQRDGILPWFPIWDDVCTFDGKPWRGRVDVVCGGFPCQDISAAGSGAGLAGARSGLWSQMARIVSEVRPGFVFVENSPLLVSRGLDVVLSDLAALGYDAQWGIVGADCTGLPHRRARMWILANSNKVRLQGEGVTGEDGGNMGEQTIQKSETANTPLLFRDWDEHARRMGGGNYGMADWVDRLKAIGNGQVPAVVCLAWEILARRALTTAP